MSRVIAEEERKALKEMPEAVLREARAAGLFGLPPILANALQDDIVIHRGLPA